MQLKLNLSTYHLQRYLVLSCFYTFTSVILGISFPDNCVSKFLQFPMSSYKTISAVTSWFLQLKLNFATKPICTYYLCLDISQIPPHIFAFISQFHLNLLRARKLVLYFFLSLHAPSMDLCPGQEPDVYFLIRQWCRVLSPSVGIFC